MHTVRHAFRPITVIVVYGTTIAIVRDHLAVVYQHIGNHIFNTIT